MWGGGRNCRCLRRIRERIRSPRRIRRSSCSALNIDPTDAWALASRGEAHLQAGRYDQARRPGPAHRIQPHAPE
ncbi:tetratricopeptide repeat protein [Streptomyces sp. NPDC057486]|uniref:tetratricopeptide repeat protein n=1 Tax=Streptomyces sp. NPDC057486 TaxID=3346145 RepID=UPI0036B13F7D